MNSIIFSMRLCYSITCHKSWYVVTAHPSPSIPGMGSHSWLPSLCDLITVWQCRSDLVLKYPTTLLRDRSRKQLISAPHKARAVLRVCCLKLAMPGQDAPFNGMFDRQAGEISKIVCELDWHSGVRFALTSGLQAFYSIGPLQIWHCPPQSSCHPLHSTETAPTKLLVILLVWK